MPAPDVCAEFDTIARLSGDKDAGGESCGWVADLIPADARTVLDAGCGAGGLARALARPDRRVVGVDFAPEMIRLAREHSRGVAGVEFVVADIMSWTPPALFDAIVSVATLHHLPLEPAVARLIAWLRPGGTLVIVDLARIAGVADFVLALGALPLVRSRRLLRQLNGRVSRDLKRAWDNHAVHDRYLSVKEARAAYARLVPGCSVRRRRPWRFVVVWRKPAPRGVPPVVS